MLSRPECTGACLGSRSPRRMAGTSWIRPELAWTCGCMQADCLAKSNAITRSLAIGWRCNSGHCSFVSARHAEDCRC